MNYLMKYLIYFEITQILININAEHAEFLNSILLVDKILK